MNTFLLPLDIGEIELFRHGNVNSLRDEKSTTLKSNLRRDAIDPLISVQLHYIW